MNIMTYLFESINKIYKITFLNFFRYSAILSSKVLCMGFKIAILLRSDSLIL